MNPNPLREIILTAVRGQVSVARKGGDMIVIRCPFCGDSDNQAHAHCTVSVAEFWWICHRCGKKGRVGEEFLAALRVPMIGSTKEILSSIRASAPQRKKMRDAREGFSAQKLTDADLKSRPVQELCERFHFRFTKEMLERYKLIPDMPRFLSENNVRPEDVDVNIMGDCIRNRICFLHASGLMVSGRAFAGLNIQRWAEARLSNANPGKFYSFARELDLREETAHILLTEGIGDLIGLDAKYGGLKRKYVMGAMLGKSLETPIRLLLHYGFASQRILIVGDSDQPEDIYREEIWRLNPLLSNMDIGIDFCRNALEKDTGVPADRIRLTQPVKLL